MKPQKHIENALKDITEEVKNIVNDSSIPLTEKDKLLFPFIQKKRVLKQVVEDLDFLDNKKYEGGETCKMSQYR